MTICQPVPLGTHPIYAEKPSRGDVDLAQRIGLPIYVVTRWYLYVVDPTTGYFFGLRQPIENATTCDGSFASAIFGATERPTLKTLKTLVSVFTAPTLVPYTAAPNSLNRRTRTHIRTDHSTLFHSKWRHMRSIRRRSAGDLLDRVPAGAVEDFQTRSGDSW